MKKDKKKAKKLLGLKDDEDLEDFKSSKQLYEENEQGDVVKGNMTSPAPKSKNAVCACILDHMQRILSFALKKSRRN